MEVPELKTQRSSKMKAKKLSEVVIKRTKPRKVKLFSTRIDAELADKFSAACKKVGIPVNEATAQLLTQGLASLLLYK